MLECAINSAFATNFLKNFPSKLPLSENESQISLNPLQVSFLTNVDTEVYAER